MVTNVTNDKASATNPIQGRRVPRQQTAPRVVRVYSTIAKTRPFVPINLFFRNDLQRMCMHTLFVCCVCVRFHAWGLGLGLQTSNGDDTEFYSDDDDYHLPSEEIGLFCAMFVCQCLYVRAYMRASTQFLNVEKVLLVATMLSHAISSTSVFGPSLWYFCSIVILIFVRVPIPTHEQLS